MSDAYDLINISLSPQKSLNYVAKDKTLIYKSKLKQFFPDFNLMFCRFCIMHLLLSRAWCLTNSMARADLTLPLRLSGVRLTPYQVHIAVQNPGQGKN